MIMTVAVAAACIIIALWKIEQAVYRSGERIGRAIETAAITHQNVDRT